MAAGPGHLDRPPTERLANHVAEVGVQRRPRRAYRGQSPAAGQVVDQLAQSIGGQYLDALNERRSSTSTAWTTRPDARRGRHGVVEPKLPHEHEHQPGPDTRLRRHRPGGGPQRGRQC